MYNYNLTYNANGNIRQSLYSGNYSGNFSSAGSYEYTYIYDNSNRLLKADNLASSSFEIINGYDKDGNFVGMKRYGSSNNLADDFGYSYFSGTNKLQTIGEGLTSYGYTYDKNGNMTSDQLNRTGSIKYDHRNLMTEIRVIKTEANPDPFGVPTIDVLYLTYYRYDEAGNRVRKVRYKYTGTDPDPVFVTEGSNPSWSLQSDEFYIRDVSGKEIAIYSGSSLTQWNIWGLDNVGKINADTTRNYYLKDHLGSIRVVLNSTNAVISAQDYDAWGYQLENRTYNSTEMRYDFTGKERDNETNYDYFGARYYDSRIGRWGGVDKLAELYKSYSPYNYTLCNPVKFIDPTGLVVELPENEFQRNLMLRLLRWGLPQTAEKYIDFKIVDGKYIIDEELLSQASSIISGSEELNALINLVNSEEITTLNFVVTGDQVDRISPNDQVVKFDIEDYIAGLTVASGNIPNPNNFSFTHFSTTGNTGVYINATKTLERMIEILAHELYGHANEYIKGNVWQHKGVGDTFDQKVGQIEANALKNFNERKSANK